MWVQHLVEWLFFCFENGSLIALTMYHGTFLYLVLEQDIRSSSSLHDLS